VSDIVVENFLPGTLARAGLGYAALKHRNPGIILVSITGFGQSGPRSQEGGYDFIMQAMSGLMQITGIDRPTKVGVAVIDVMTGLYAVTAALAALNGRKTTGTGTHVDVALLYVLYPHGCHLLNVIVT